MSENIRLSKDGTWWHEGQEVTHARTQDLFFKSVLFADGRYFLTGEKKPVPIEVEDVAFFVKGVKRLPGKIVVQLSNQTEETLDLASLDVPQNNELTCRLQNGAPAKFLSKAYYDLMRDLQKHEDYLGLMRDGLFYPLQRAGQEPKQKPPVAKVKALSKGVKKAQAATKKTQQKSVKKTKLKKPAKKKK